MPNKIDKILRLQLTLLFIVTMTSFVAFYFQDSLPDNYLSISSKVTSTNIISYSFYSLIASTGYYFGLWLIFPFLLFALFYTLLYSQRSYILDIFNILPLIVSACLASVLIASDIVGDGLLFVIKSSFTEVNIGLGSLLALILFLASSYRSSFKSSLITMFVMLGKSPEYLVKVLRALNPSRPLKKVGSFFKWSKEKTSIAVPNLLKGEKTSSDHVLQRKKESYFTPLSRATMKEEREDELPDNLESEFKEPTTLNDSQETDSIETQMKPLSRDLAKVEYKAKQGKKREKEYYSIVEALSKSQKRSRNTHPDNEYFDKIIRALEETLGEFKIDGKIVNILKGPVVDTFELELGPGVKVSKITNSENELSMALLGAPIRIVYPMIGRATVGIEVPRNPREIIYLDEVLASREYQKTNMKLPVAMGKNAFGETFVVDLAAMPHMLVAGATGAGKSVFINTLLVSLLAKKSPSQMKLILIDPKQLELALYATLPHLVMPVLTGPKEASYSLLWACQEMERRYSILKEFGVRNIEGFNDKLKNATPEMLSRIHSHYENEIEDHYELPYLVIIVDEFADLILTKAGKDIENNICRLAAKARAAGIHLVLATQRPSVDVITGLIKSNFPTRVSFRVTSSVDSRTILNSVGAEKLLGKGDMLYRHGTDNLRVHSSYVDEDEIEALTDKLANMPRSYHNGAMDFLENGGESESDPYAFGSHLPSVSDGDSSDEYFKDAVKIVVEHRTASASMLQRRMKIGYNRAANLIEEMEAKGIVGPAEGSKRRKVLVGSEE